MPDAAAEGSVTITLINTDTNKTIGDPVPVGGGAKFSTIIPLTNSVQHIQVVTSDTSYKPQNITVRALTRRPVNPGTVTGGGAGTVTAPVAGNTNTGSTTTTAPRATTTTTVAPHATKAAKKRYSVMHKATVYNKSLKKVGTKKAYSKVTVYGKKTIKGRKYLRIGANKYVLATNVTGTLRKLTHNAHVYKNSGKLANKKVLKKGRKVRTYGGSMKIKGHASYRIGKNQYVRVSCFR